MTDESNIIVTVAEVKSHLRLDPAFDNGEDLMLDSLIRAAQEFISNETGVDWANRTDDAGQPIEPPCLIRAAVLLIVGHYYANREAASPLTLNNIPLGVDRIINQYRIVELL